MSESKIDKKYTELWTNDEFNSQRVGKYDNKFKNKWEKNIKHQQQVRLISKYLTQDMFWCDFPIGSGRLMDDLQSKSMMGLDISDSFLEYNRNKGRDCEKADILNHDYQDKFDLVTSMHTIAAFSEGEQILAGYVKSLKSQGLLIVDIPNRVDKEQDFAMTKAQVTQFFEKQSCDVLEMTYHDFWDNPKILKWRSRDNRFKRELWWLVNRAYFSKYQTIAKTTFFVLDKIEKLFGEQYFTKILVVAKKR